MLDSFRFIYSVIVVLSSIFVPLLFSFPYGREVLIRVAYRKLFFFFFGMLCERGKGGRKGDVIMDTHISLVASYKCLFLFSFVFFVFI